MGYPPQSPAQRRSIWKSATVGALTDQGGGSEAGKEGACPGEGPGSPFHLKVGSWGLPSMIRGEKTSTCGPPRHCTQLVHSSAPGPVSQPEQGPHYLLTDRNAEAQEGHLPPLPSPPQKLKGEGERQVGFSPPWPGGQHRASSFPAIPLSTLLLGTANGMMRPEARATEQFGGTEP